MKMQTLSGVAGVLICDVSCQAVGLAVVPNEASFYRGRNFHDLDLVSVLEQDVCSAVKPSAIAVRRLKSRQGM